MAKIKRKKEQLPLEDEEEKPIVEEQVDNDNDIMEAVLTKLQEMDTRLSQMETKDLPVEESIIEQTNDEDKVKEEALTPGKQLNPEEPERETGEKKIKMPTPTVVGADEPNKPIDSIPDTTQPSVGTPPGEELEKKMKVAPSINALEKEQVDEDKEKEQVTEDDDKKKEQVDEDKEKEQVTDGNPKDADNDKKEQVDEDEKNKEDMMGGVTDKGPDDPNKPKPGESSPTPNPMEGASKQKLDIHKEVYDKITQELKTEIKGKQLHESLFTRQTQVGMSAKETSQVEANNEEFRTIKENVNTTVHEYLAKCGQGNILNA